MIPPASAPATGRALQAHFVAAMPFVVPRAAWEWGADCPGVLVREGSPTGTPQLVVAVVLWAPGCLPVPCVTVGCVEPIMIKSRLLSSEEPVGLRVSRYSNRPVGSGASPSPI